MFLFLMVMHGGDYVRIATFCRLSLHLWCIWLTCPGSPPPRLNLCADTRRICNNLPLSYCQNLHMVFSFLFKGLFACGAVQDKYLDMPYWCGANDLSAQLWCGHTSILVNFMSFTDFWRSSTSFLLSTWLWWIEPETFQSRVGYTTPI